jgi:hypothetical protein
MQSHRVARLLRIIVDVRTLGIQVFRHFDPREKPYDVLTLWYGG